jgi:peptide/nickel transport system ATP-binding protein
MSLLQVNNLRTYFGTPESPKKVVDDVSFAIEAGQTLGLVGESGCGKSLTALSIMQLLPTAARNAGGQVLFKGKDVLKLPPASRRYMRGRNISMIFQEPMTSLNPVLSVRTQLLEAVGKSIRQGGPDGAVRYLSRSERVEQAVEALRLVEMPEPERRLGEYPHQLSGGMRQRVMIAMAMASRPELLIADEPTTALDVTVEAKILDLLRDLQARLGMSILFITHDLAVIAKMASRVAVMYAGKIVETAPADDLFAQPLHPYTERLLRCRPSRDRRGQNLDTIRGIVPSPEDYPRGCRFCDRCPRVFGPCRMNEPPLAAVEPDHFVACHLYAGAARPEIWTHPAAEAAAATGQKPHDGALLDIRGLSMHFPIRKGIFQRVVGHVRAVDGVDMTIRRGQTVALVGESGCGKTTLGKTLIRLLPPSAGSVWFDGQDIMALDGRSLLHFRRRAQVVFQDPYSSLNPRMLVQDIIEEGMKVHRIGADHADRLERIKALMAEVGLEQNAMTCYPHEFSGGQRQRIGIARALAVQPQFIVLDEPTSALDASIQAQILNLLKRLQRRGKDEWLTYMFITHDLGVVEYLSDEVAVMYLGRIVEQASTERLFDEPLHPYSEALLSAVPDLGKRTGRQRIRIDGDVPSPSKPPPGCHFHPRCRRAMPICKQIYPPVTDLGEGRTVRCHLHGKN